MERHYNMDNEHQSNNTPSTLAAHKDGTYHSHIHVPYTCVTINKLKESILAKKFI